MKINTPVKLGDTIYRFTYLWERINDELKALMIVVEEKVKTISIMISSDKGKERIIYYINGSLLNEGAFLTRKQAQTNADKYNKEILQ